METKFKYLYVLDGKIPVAVEDARAWGDWFENHVEDRVVKQEEISRDIRVSTVFVSIDHGHAWMNGQPGYKPLLFETLVMGGPLDGYQLRYSTWMEAEEGHDKVLELVKAEMKKILDFFD